MNIDITQATLEDKPLIQRLMAFYQYDFSEIEGTDLDQQGCYDYPYLDHYWVEEGRFPFLVRVDGKLAGFVLVNGYTLLVRKGFAIAEFFIMRKYRRQGIGKAAAFYVFNQFPGDWEIRQREVNIGAQCFWRKVVMEYTAGQYTEMVLGDKDWKGLVQTFNNDS